MSLLPTALKNFETDLAARRLTDGEIEALEYYAENQITKDAGMAAAYIRQAIIELRAVRAAGVIVNLPPAKEPPAPLHLAECTPPDDAIDAEWGCASTCPVWRKKCHDEWIASDGKWTCSTNEEHFDCRDWFDAEEDAIEYGKVFAEEMGIEDGGLYWTGRIHIIHASEIAESGFAAWNAVESMEEAVADQCGDEVSYQIEPSLAEQSDLEARVRPVIAQWLEAHHLTPSCAMIEKSRSHVFHVCPEVDSSRLDPANHPRCTKAKGHGGDHEWDQ